MSEPQMPINTVKIAYKGQAVNLDNLPVYNLPKAAEVSIQSEFKDYEPDSSVDLTDLREVNKEITNLRIRLHRIRKELDKANRFSAQANYQYEQQKKRIWVGLSGGSDKQREAIAELMTEELLSRALVAKTVAAELLQHSRDTRTELDALKEISNNLRRQIEIM